MGGKFRHSGSTAKITKISTPRKLPAIRVSQKYMWCRNWSKIYVWQNCSSQAHRLFQVSIIVTACWMNTFWTRLVASYFFTGVKMADWLYRLLPNRVPLESEWGRSDEAPWALVTWPSIRLPGATSRIIIVVIATAHRISMTHISWIVTYMYKLCWKLTVFNNQHVQFAKKGSVQTNKRTNLWISNPH